MRAPVVFQLMVCIPSLATNTRAMRTKLRRNVELSIGHPEDLRPSGIERGSTDYRNGV